MNKPFYEIDRFTQRMVRYKQIFKPPQRVQDCDMPYVYVRKRWWRENGEPNFVQINITPCDFDKEETDESSN